MNESMFFGGLDNEAILPEGGDTLHVHDDSTNDPVIPDLDGEQESETADADTSEDETPTTGESEEKENTEVSEPSDEKVVNEPREIETKFNHKTQTHNLDEMSDEEIAIRFQKAMQYDNMVKRESERIRQETYDAQIADGMTEAVANLVADAEVKNRFGASEEEPEEEPAEEPAPVDNFQEQVKKLRAAYPDCDSLPDKVMNDYFNHGIPLIEGYGAWMNNQNKANAASIEKENKVLRQNAASAAKAPVTGVKGSGKITAEKPSAFEMGLNSNPW